jgi:hypothetical protein
VREDGNNRVTPVEGGDVMEEALERERGRERGRERTNFKTLQFSAGVFRYQSLQKSCIEN